MQTHFSAAQLADPATRAMDGILRKCVHCGFCNSACPTFRLTGDELDGPRGRIYLIKDMLEHDSAPAASTVKHIDRCLSCLACMSACPSGVDYMHLVDHARSRIHERGPRDFAGRLLRLALAAILPHPRRLKLLAAVGRAARSIAPRLPAGVRAKLRLLPTAGAANTSTPLPDFSAATVTRRGSVALLAGCVQQVFGQEVNHASVRVLNRAGFDVQVLRDGQCCGAIEHHLGRVNPALRRIRANVLNWSRRLQSGEFSAILSNASGCGTMVRDYAHLLRDEAPLAVDADRVSRAALDIAAFLVGIPLARTATDIPGNLSVVCQNPCSMQHGQKVRGQPLDALRACGFEVHEPADGQACCGSAGTYNLLQAEFAEQLGRQKGRALKATGAQVIASGNLGCMLQIRQYVDIPVVHTVQLLDWATGGPAPPPLNTGRLQEQAGS